MSDMAFYARLHIEAMAARAESRKEKILALTLRIRGAARAMAMAREVGDERGN